MISNDEKLITFSCKKICEGIKFYKTCRHAACNFSSNRVKKMIGDKAQTFRYV